MDLGTGPLYRPGQSFLSRKDNNAMSLTSHRTKRLMFRQVESKRESYGERIQRAGEEPENVDFISLSLNT